MNIIILAKNSNFIQDEKNIRYHRTTSEINNYNFYQKKR